MSETVSCALCGSVAGAELMRGRDERLRVDAACYALRSCASCGHVYLSPRPDARELGRYYPERFYPLRVEEAPARWRPGGSRRTTINKEKLERVEALRPERGLLLDIGCAEGSFLACAREHGWRVAGVEFDLAAAEWVRANLDIDVASGAVEEAELPEGVAVATLWSSLEHLMDPLRALRRVKEVLAPGGLVVALVPNIEAWESRCAGRHWPHLDIPRHLHHFSPTSLRHALEGAGLRVRSIATPSTAIEVTHWNAVWSRAWRPPHRVDVGLRVLTAPVLAALCSIAAARGRNHSLLAVAERSLDAR